MPGSPGKNGARRERLGHNIRDALTEMIAADVRDPRVHAPTMLTVARVELNVDLSVANCYISIVGDDATADAAIEGLKKAAGFLRGPLGRRLSLQRAPELRFSLDPSIDVGAKLRAIVKEDEERARAAGREIGVTVSPPKQEAGPSHPEEKPGPSLREDENPGPPPPAASPKPEAGS
jgi:ribosome-binding factor A